MICVHENTKTSSLTARMNDEQFADLHAAVNRFTARIKDAQLKAVFERCFFNTLNTTSFFEPDDSVYLITGDIPAMWLRDSAAQVFQYLPFAKECPSVQRLIKGLLKRQFDCIVHDPYANAFNESADGNGHVDDLPKQSPLVWERKFELDSLCYPFWLLCKYVDATGDLSCLTDGFLTAFDAAMRTLHIEQDHFGRSEYTHANPANRHPERFIGRGTPVAVTGLVWSGYRPSDDKTEYGYFIPGNMFIVSVLVQLEKLLRCVAKDEARADACRDLYTEIQAALEKYAVTENALGQRIYAYETDGLGHYNLMDDANIPSLFAIPYMEYPFYDSQVYADTRAHLLSPANPHYWVGETIAGIGSPHGGGDEYVWPMSVIIQAMTTDDKAEINRLIQMLIASTGGTGYMHESVHKDDDTRFTRPWFAWANSLFASLILQKQDQIDGIG